MHWTAGRPDGMTRRSDGWQGIEISDLQIVQNFLETLLNSGIPDKKTSLQRSDFVQQNVTNYKLTIFNYMIILFVPCEISYHLVHN